WKPFAKSFWGGHRLGLDRMSHVTVVVNDAIAAERFYVDLLDAAPLPDQAATHVDATSRFVMVGEDTILELLSPLDPDSRAGRDLAEAGESVISVTFTIQNVASALQVLTRADAPIVTRTDHDIVFDVERTWGCEYHLTTRVLAGDPRLPDAASSH